MSERDQYVVGVDYGTLSGRALVVRVSDGAELGTATHDYAHGVVEDRLPGSDVLLPPEWALQVPDDYRDVLRHAVPAAVAAAGIDPADVVGIATDFTACTMVPTLADGTPLCEVDGLAGRPHSYVKLWKHHAAQGQADRINQLAADRGESWLPRYGGLISSEWEFAKGLQLFEEDREVYDRMERWVEAADWIVWQLSGSYVRNACTAGYKGQYQFGKDGEYPSPEFLGALSPGFDSFVADKLEHPIGQLGERAGGLTAEAAAWTGLPGRDRGRGRQRRRPRHRARGAGRARRPDGRDHGHLDLPRDERRRAARGAGHVRRRRRRHRGRQLGLRGRAERGRRHLRVVHRDVRAGGVRHGRGSGGRVAARAPHPARGRAGDRRARPGRARLAQRQPLGAGRPRALGPRGRPDPRHPARARLPRAARGHGVRHPRDRRDLPRQRGAGRGVHRRRRPRQERPADADLRRRDPAAAVDHRLRAGAGARLGHPCRRRRRRLRRRADRRQVDGQGAQGRLPARRGAGHGVRRAVRRVPRRCTTTSAGRPR